LLSVIAGLEIPDSGTVAVCGEPVRGPTRRVGFMPQRDQLFPWRTIRDNVLLGLQIRGGVDPPHLQHVDTLLRRYGLEDFARLVPSQLSGGMRQRCALIRTLATDPDILLLDEPFSALDYQTRLSVSGDIWRIIRSERKTALLVTHDIAEAVSMADRVVVLSQRPATVKAVFDMEQLQQLTPLQRRESPLFSRYFDSVWKELEIP
jgi:NitT/TauT family transport system ATP-binding protein